MTPRTRIAVYYAAWATLCAAFAGVVITVLHVTLFSYHPDLQAFLRTFGGDLATALGLAAGQGAIAFLTAAVLERFNRELRYTALLGLLIGVFDFGMYLLQMAVPVTELGWGPDLAIVGGVAVIITLLGTRSSERGTRS